MSAGGAVVIGLLVVAAGLAVVRVLRPARLGDRIVAFDLLGSLVTCGILVAAAETGDGILLDLAVVLGLLGFLTSVTVARFIESRSKGGS